MSIKKEELKFKAGDLVKIDYTPELDRRTQLNERQINRNHRLALILDIVEKELVGDFNSISYLFRYKIIVGNEIVEIDQACITKV